ncbi:hypothetical protein EVAR_61637_1 [Eumeta japonica]|uniref:Uncharacterized protein n=1 Tax=Eumeta variegata TaxID=151549 RepID=A0A4C1Z8T1_EUMVA|nr:hypothetical protein EVAR_61637_1 [Eumeta japonica]
MIRVFSYSPRLSHPPARAVRRPRYARSGSLAAAVARDTTASNTDVLYALTVLACARSDRFDLAQVENSSICPPSDSKATLLTVLHRSPPDEEQVKTNVVLQVHYALVRSARCARRTLTARITKPRTTLLTSPNVNACAGRRAVSGSKTAKVGASSGPVFFKVGGPDYIDAAWPAPVGGYQRCRCHGA